MRHVISGGFIAAALGTGMLVAGAFPAAAQVARPQSAVATGDNGGLLTLVRDGRMGGGSGRSGGKSGGMPGGMAHAQGFGGPSAQMSAPRMSGNNQPHISGNNPQWTHNNNWNNNWRHNHHDHDHDHNHFSVGFAFGSPYYYDDYAYDPGYYTYGAAGPDDEAVAYCLSRFQTYNTATGTYLGYDGLQHPCP